jgi:hypothetical protein
MVCCVVLKSKIKIKHLFLNRHKQMELTKHLESRLNYKPFIFNSTKGVYIFIKNKESFESIKKILVLFLHEYDLNEIKIFDTSKRSNFFRNLTKQTLNSEDISAYGWKKFISSFLFQINPYSASSASNTFEIFENFRNSVKNSGTKYQMKYFKRRMKKMRKGVSLVSIEQLLKLD